MVPGTAAHLVKIWLANIVSPLMQLVWMCDPALLLPLYPMGLLGLACSDSQAVLTLIFTEL